MLRSRSSLMPYGRDGLDKLLADGLVSYPRPDRSKLSPLLPSSVSLNGIAEKFTRIFTIRGCAGRYVYQSSRGKGMVGFF